MITSLRVIRPPGNHALRVYVGSRRLLRRASSALQKSSTSQNILVIMSSFIETPPVPVQWFFAYSIILPVGVSFSPSNSRYLTYKEINMKKKILSIVIIIMVAGSAFADWQGLRRNISPCDTWLLVQKYFQNESCAQLEFDSMLNSFIGEYRVTFYPYVIVSSNFIHYNYDAMETIYNNMGDIPWNLLNSLFSYQIFSLSYLNDYYEHIFMVLGISFTKAIR